MKRSTSRSPDALSRWAHLWIIAVFACFLCGAGRLVYIQDRLSDRLLAYRDDQQTRQIILPAKRGMILDTRGRILAGSQTAPSVFADPQLVRNPDVLAEQLATFLGTDSLGLIEKLHERRDSRFVWIARHISAAEAQAIRALQLSGVRVIDEDRRFYPNGPLLAHVLGFVDIDGRGLEGLELYYDDRLSGQPGKHLTTCDAGRRPLLTRIDNLSQPAHGAHLVLTIDATLQSFAEETLRNTVRRFEAQSGVAIVMAPQKGDILAMCAYPTFDPNHHRDYAPDHKRNRCLTDPVEPGSIFKPFIIASALDRGIISPQERFDCGQGVWYFGSRRIRDTHDNGLLTVEGILVKSSNIGMGKIGTLMGNEALYEAVRNLGFGSKSGVDLPGENDGIVVPLSRWTSYSTTSVPMGQELAVTPIQLICAFATLLNHGRCTTPRVVRGWLDPADNALIPAPTPDARPVLSNQVADVVARQMMARMVSESHHDIQLAQHRMVGKTGTAQVPFDDRRGYEPGAYLASFIGAAPANDPQVAVLMMIRKPNSSIAYYGGAVAGPAVRDIVAYTLSYWNMDHVQSMN